MRATKYMSRTTRFQIFDSNFATLKVVNTGLVDKLGGFFSLSLCNEANFDPL